MNDRFKFRVWDKQDGCYAYSNNSDVNLYIETDGHLTYGIYTNDYEDMDYMPESEVIVEQCTGLKDKNGKLIYEGDIILVDDDKCPIEWDSDNARYNVVGYGEIAYLNYNDIEVIGNIYQNPELLEEYNAD